MGGRLRNSFPHVTVYVKIVKYGMMRRDKTFLFSSLFKGRNKTLLTDYRK